MFVAAHLERSSRGMAAAGHSLSLDVGGALVGSAPSTCHLLCKSPGVLAGVPFVNHVFDYLGCTIAWADKEGDFLDASQEHRRLVATVQGPTHRLLQGERLALNLLSRCSGIATKTRQMKQVVGGWKGKLAATRKTTPGFGLVEKYGVLVGGGSTHRMGLSNSVMIKDNHLWAFKGTKTLAGLVREAKALAPHTMKVEVEVRDWEEAQAAATAGADIIMLDNFDPVRLQDTSSRLKADFPHVLLEASGGITMSSIRSFALSTIDVISQGSLTYNCEIVDFSMKVNR